MLFQDINNAIENGFLDINNYKSLQPHITKNLNQKFQIREYQKEAIARFLYYFCDYKNKKLPIHLLFNMATGSGKTFIMASLILELYEKLYRNFLFFVNSTNIIEKTKENFLNSSSQKYLFHDKIEINGKLITIKEVKNFSENNDENINIKFTTIQGLHTDLNTIKENSITYDDFLDKKIVIISDEAHHINALTKNGKLGNQELQEKTSWEQTILKILNSNKENILLEFTATIDLTNPNIYQKYLDKIIYKYDLKEFRLDGYSKEVDILKADLEQKDRILQALLLSQYRLKIAEKHKIHLKPVILFKAQKTIAESEKNLENFNILIKNLTTSDLENLKSKTNIPIIKKAFEFFGDLEALTKELKQDFCENNCISANDNSDLVSVKLNTLEDEKNNIRAVFAVAKLNEGWDVLNLFDIVRLYGDDGITAKRSNVIDKKTGKIIPGPQTISEAQLIGRGARYYPFVTQENTTNEKYKRKFDKKEDELKILETFYYHTFFENQYITEIKQALKEVGMMDEKDKTDFELKFKNTFKSSGFYTNGLVYTNKRIEKKYTQTQSLEDFGIKIKSIDYKNIFSGTGAIDEVFLENRIENISLEPKSISIDQIDKRIILKALARNEFYNFCNLKKYFGKLTSIDEFISDKKYLGDIKINFYSTKDILENLNCEHKLSAVSKLLKELESELKANKIEYKGTKTFFAKSLSNYEFEKVIKIDIGTNIFSKNHDWFVFENIVGTSEEVNFIELFEVKMQELSLKFDDIYLIRNERAVAIYSFENGDRFEPDFLLFMKEKLTNKNLHYQIFIEPKGEHLVLNDKWKENFLLQINSQYEILELELEKYKLIGLPFYNKSIEGEFIEYFEKL